MYEFVDKGVEGGQRFITYVDNKTGLKNTYYESEFERIEDVELREFLNANK